MRSSDVTNIEEAIHYKFNDKSLLKLALTHTSYVNEKKLSDYDSNERLEFLGDSVLGLIISDVLFNYKEALLEGDMTKIRSKIVNEQALAYISSRIMLGDYLYLGNGEDANGGRQRSSIISSALEALIGAIYLDSGYERTKLVVKDVFKNVINRAIITDDFFEDYKTLLQEHAQKGNLGNPLYNVISESGPDHNKNYCVEVRIGDIELTGTGYGRSKKEAEKNAAKELLSKI